MAGASWVTSAKDGKVGWALKQDYADAAVLSGNGHENTIYATNFPEIIDRGREAELVSTAREGEVLGKEVSVQQVDDAMYADSVKKAGVPDSLIPMLVGIQKSIRGRPWKSRAMILKNCSAVQPPQLKKH